ncbi:MAG TPA: AbrB/MazE/SpoVT family DNA-binding domain-containing protein [Candidatus Moranbacteria bacterium]|nr:AbrB/MazE/SpoVT family DNA-binding domain-containing protein [Candidatus Moranbacteria bacterium]
MARRILKEKNIRKLTRMGRAGSSLGLTIPKELTTQLGWHERQKVVVSKKGENLIIKDWEKQHIH